MDYKTYLECWEEYKFLENDFQKVMAHVPLEEEHMEVWSLELGRILILLGSMVDSFFKYAIKDLHFNDIPEIDSIERGDDADMRDYEEIFERYYCLSSKKVYVRCKGATIKPFESWSEDNSLEWWKAYQAVKHDKFANKKEAKLKHVLYGMAGFFLLNTIHIPSRIVLLRLGLWKGEWSEGWSPRHLEENVFNHKEPIPVEEIFSLKTNLFGYILQSTLEHTKMDKAWDNYLGVLQGTGY